MTASLPPISRDIRYDTPDRDEDALLALNNAHAEETSPLDLSRLRDLLASACHARAVGTADALLIAFDQTAVYDSPNFLWFRERFDRFVYIDRVIVAAEHRGRGLARHLYAVLVEAAREAGHSRVVCEVNSDPPNPVSDQFHASLGFRMVGDKRLANGKSVRYLALQVP